MEYWTKNRVGIKLIHILNKLKIGRYELEWSAKKNRFDLVIYNEANYGIYAGIYYPKADILQAQFVRLQELITTLNKYG